MRSSDLTQYVMPIQFLLGMGAPRVKAKAVAGPGFGWAYLRSGKFFWPGRRFGAMPLAASVSSTESYQVPMR